MVKLARDQGIDVLLVAVPGLMRVQGNDDLRSLQSSPAELIAQQREVGRLLGMPSPAQFFLVQGRDAEQVLQREERLVARLRDIEADGSVGGHRALSDWLPSQRRQDADAALTSRVERHVLARLSTVTGETLARGEFAASALDIDAFLASPASLPVRSLWLGKVGQGMASVVMVNDLSRPDALAVFAAQAKGLNLRFRLPRGPAGEYPVLHTDPMLLHSVLRNLVSNALRYTQRGGVLVAARRRGRNRLRIEVWDTGIGIPDDQRERIFEEFYQVGNAARDRSKGIGLGLAIVRRMASIMGERIEVRSRAGKGSCFAIELPLHDNQPLSHTEEVQLVEPLKSRTVWLVEDDVLLRRALQEMLRSWGAQVRTWEDAETLIDDLPQIMMHAPDSLPDTVLFQADSYEQLFQQITDSFGPQVNFVLKPKQLAKTEPLKALNRIQVQLSSLSPETGGYTLVDFSEPLDDELQAVLVYRSDLQRVLELAVEVGIYAAPAYEALKAAQEAE